MSFARALREIEALERQAAELERQSRGKDNELLRLRGTSAGGSPVAIQHVVKLLADGDDVARLAEFVDLHQSLETGMNLTKVFTPEDVDALVNALAERLKKKDDKEDITIEALRLARGLLRESRNVCGPLLQNTFALFLERLTRQHSPAVREGALRCLQLCLQRNQQLRDLLIENEQAIDRLTLAIEEMGHVIRDQDLSSHVESARAIVVLKHLFDGSQGHEDRIVARLLIKSGFVSATIERMTKAFLEIVDLPSKTLIESSNPLLSTTFDGIGRGTILIDGFRFMYVVATFADVDLLQAMLQNDGKTTLQGDELKKCDLSNPDLGMGDRFVFLQTHVMLVNAPHNALKKDVDNLDQIKSSLCSTLMFADRAPGFVAYLYDHGVSRTLFELLDRETTRAKLPGGNEGNLLNILIAIKTLVDKNDDMKDHFQDMMFERLLPDLDPADYATEEEFMQAKEKRHYGGRSIPETAFGKVVQLLTSFEDHVKRFAGELLYTLCDEDPKKVIHFVGFGHAAHLLSYKGALAGMGGQIGGASE